MSFQELAKTYIGHGLSVIPIRTDETKAPELVEWKTFQSRFPSADELSSFREGAGVAVIAGAVSGNCEIYDVDDAETFAPWADLVEEHLGHDFFAALTIVKTPRPGFHVYTRCRTIGGNTKLAQVMLNDGKRPRVKTLIETRGEGGYVLAPGCPATCHETGRTYELIQGSFATIPNISIAEREVLMSCARSFNQLWRQPEEPHKETAAKDSPGSDFCAKASWAEVLKPHGFKFAGKRGECELWTRPDKDHGVSASTNHNGSDLFYSFSTNCFPFDSERGYNKFGVYALLNHAGDFRAAAKALGSSGYGTPKQRQATTTTPTAAASDIVAVSDLRARVLALYATGLQPGVSPGWESLREFWTLRPGDWTVVTGTPGHGKSSAMDNVMLNTASANGWNWAIWSAENLPQELHVANLVSIYAGRPFSSGALARVSMSELTRAMDFIEERFRFIAPPEDDETLQRILADVDLLMAERAVHGVLIDPWNELTHSYPNTETEYISNCLKSVRRFVASRKCHLVLVAHPTKLKKQPDGSYPVPTPWDISGSGTWRAKADNALCVWRDESQPGTATVFVQKVRRRFVGKIGSAVLDYDVPTGQFSEPGRRERASFPSHPVREPGMDDE